MLVKRVRVVHLPLLFFFLFSVLILWVFVGVLVRVFGVCDLAMQLHGSGENGSFL